MSTGNGSATRTGPGQAIQPLGAQLATSVGTLLAAAVVAFVVAAPFAWLLMLFLGNLGVERAGFWECLPGGVLVGALVATGKGKT